MKQLNRMSHRAFILSIFLMRMFIGVCSVSATEKDVNVVLITIDALRADHLSCYGYDRNTSPNIDSIAEKGSVFNNVIAPCSWTAPSVVSLLTSVYPINHGVKHGIGYKKNKTIHIQEVFSSKLFTLAEILKTQGYTTFGVASNLHLDEQFGFARGFDYFHCLPFLPAPIVNKRVYAWEEQIRQADKFFLWIHYFDPHHFYHARTPWIDNYTPRELTEELKLSNKKWPELTQLISTFKRDPQTLSNLIALYDSEINFVDSHIGELIQKCDLDKDTLLIITSDHGEEFLDHGKLGHGHDLHRAVINIPLIIKQPDGSEKKAVNKQVSLLDIMPTILRFLDIDPPEYLLGKSLWKTYDPFSWFKKTLLRKDAIQYNFSEVEARATLKAIITPEWKYIYNFKMQTGQLYNIQVDPLELNNLADKRVDKSSQLKEQLFNWVSTAKQYPPKKQEFQLTPQEKEKLQGLGYIQ